MLDDFFSLQSTIRTGDSDVFTDSTLPMVAKEPSPSLTDDDKSTAAKQDKVIR